MIKVTGAKRKDILQLFLFETYLISAIGAVIGTIVGVILAHLFTTIEIFGLHVPLTFRFKWFIIAIPIGLYPLLNLQLHRLS